MELTEEVLQQCKGFTCKDEDIGYYILSSNFFEGVSFYE